ncbi:hypothetical protein E4U52_006913 [Claviceps spartinae]|nr:hypothetical protein E4U52_006913 [Claviceps spartinae]
MDKLKLGMKLLDLPSADGTESAQTPADANAKSAPLEKLGTNDKYEITTTTVTMNRATASPTGRSARSLDKQLDGSYENLQVYKEAKIQVRNLFRKLHISFMRPVISLPLIEWTFSYDEGDRELFLGYLLLFIFKAILAEIAAHCLINGSYDRTLRCGESTTAISRPPQSQTSCMNV